MAVIVCVMDEKSGGDAGDRFEGDVKYEIHGDTEPPEGSDPTGIVVEDDVETDAEQSKEREQEKVIEEPRFSHWDQAVKEIAAGVGMEE